MQNIWHGTLEWSKQNHQYNASAAVTRSSNQRNTKLTRLCETKESHKKNAWSLAPDLVHSCFKVKIQNMLPLFWDSIVRLKKYWKIFPIRKRFPKTGALTIFLIIIILLNSCCTEGRKIKRPESCLSSSNDENKSFLWRTVSDTPSYFFGTIHVPYSRVWDHVPENVKRAFEAADAVFFELDLTDPGTITALSSCQLLPAGQSLADLLPKDVYDRLRRHLDYIKKIMPSWMSPDQRGRGLYADYLFRTITGNWERKRPIWVMLMVNSLTESDIKSRGIPVLDLYLAQEAERRNKRMGAVEKVEEQCVPLNGLHLSQVVFALNQTLHHAESLRTGDLSVQFTTDDLIKHYNCGDLDAVIFNQDTAQVPTLTNATLSPFEKVMAKKIDDYFRQELIFKRNRRMGQRVLELLEAHPDKSFFFAFGAGHFLGNHTVLDVIQAGGYSVEQLGSNQKVLRHKKKPQARLREVLLPEPSSLKDFSPFSSNSAKLRRDQVPQSSVGSLNANGESVVPSRNPQASSAVYHTTFRPPTLLKTSHNVILPHLTARSHFFNDKYRNFNELWVRIENDQLQNTLKPPTVRDATSNWFTSKPYRSSAVCKKSSTEFLFLMIVLVRLLFFLNHQ